MIELDLTKREEEYLTAAVCQFYHDMKTSHESEIYGALILSEAVLDARSLWNKVENLTRVAEWK